MARKGNPISVRLDLFRSSDSSWFSDYYYGKFVYQDVNLRSYLGSIRPPTRLTFGFRLGRCIILHFPKRTLIHFFLPRRARRLKRRDKSRPGKAKGQWLWELRKVFRRMSSNKSTEEAGDRAEGKREESIRLDDREKQKGIRIWPKKMQRYGYHDQSPSIKEKLRALNPYFYSIFPYLQKSPSSVSPSYLFHYFVTQYFFHNIKKMNFHPVHVLNHFVASGVAEPGEAKEESNELRIRSRIAFFVESSTCGGEKKYLAQAKKGLIHFIRQANDLRFAGTRKKSISLFPFFVATFFFPREDPIGVPSELKVTKQIPAADKKKLLKLLRKIFLNLIGQNKVVMGQIEKFIDLGRIRVLRKYISIIIKKLLRNLIIKKLLRKGRVKVRKGGRVKGCNKYNYDVKKMRSFLSRRVKGWCNKYNYDVKKMRSFLSNRTQTNTLIFSVKIPSFYQSASLIAKDISLQTRKKKISFRSIYSNVVKGISLTMQKGVVGGIRISCSGRLGGAEIARTEWGKYGKTSCNVLNQKLDYGPAKVCTRNGILGVKVRISYS